jgi:uncharacterized protein
MIDSHIHVVETKLPGVPLKAAGEILFDGPPEPLAAFLRKSMQEAGVQQVLAMGSWDAPPDDPLGINGTLRLATLVPGLHAIGVADPTRTDPDHFRRVEEVLAAGKVRAFKAYLGYLPYGPEHPNYAPYLELAARYDIPFVMHTGDTYSPRAKLKYAHPLLVDEVAVDHPDVRFVMAHLGNPWLVDAAQVLYKNANVWADLSGLLVGPTERFLSYRDRGIWKDVGQGVLRAFRYSERPDRFLFGTDWPLAPMALYRDMIRTIIPEPYHQAVFEDNAKALFELP